MARAWLGAVLVGALGVSILGPVRRVQAEAVVGGSGSSCSDARSVEESFQCVGDMAPPDGRRAKVARVPSEGHLRAVAVFAGFSEDAGVPVPSYAQDLFDLERPGSFSHFYRTMSFGQLIIEGAAFPKRYLVAHPASYYLTTVPEAPRGPFVRDILGQADVDVDFGAFDANHDGYVDAVFINLVWAPEHFLLGSATGILGLGLSEDFRTNDRGIRIRGDYHADGPGGTVQAVYGFAHAVGVMAHEYGHLLGLPDLYDTGFLSDPGQEPEKDSAGIGKWGLMGHGSLGWNGDDGPNPLCAWSREQLGWIGPNNERLVEVWEDMKDVPIEPVESGGKVYRLSYPRGEYFLIEHRRATAGYYDRHIPKSGLLIWHIAPTGTNTMEERKRVDVECADGLFADKGYPMGQIPDPVSGRDNLDFWAHDEGYREMHGGNLGDATDVFDGARFTAFSMETNPSSADYGGYSRRGSRGIAVKRIRREGTTMIADLFPLDDLLTEYTIVDSRPSEFDPEPSTVGNGDGKVAPGERIALYVKLSNLTFRTLSSLRMTALADDPEIGLYVRIEHPDLLADRGPLLRGNEMANVRTISFMVPSTSPEGHQIPVYLEITDEERAWRDTLFIPVEGSDPMPPHFSSLSVTPKTGGVDEFRYIEARMVEGGDLAYVAAQIVRVGDGAVMDSVRLYEKVDQRNRVTGDRVFVGSWTPSVSADLYVALSAADVYGHRAVSVPWIGITTQPFTPSSPILRVDHLPPGEEDGVGEALAADGWSHDLWNTYCRGPVDRGVLLSYARKGVVLWLSMEEEGVEEDLRAYLDAGGHLLIAGEGRFYGGNVARSLSSNFVRQYLHAEIAGVSDQVRLSGVEGDPISDGLLIDYLTPTVRGAYRTLLAYGFKPCTCGGTNDTGLGEDVTPEAPLDPSMVPSELLCSCGCGGFTVQQGALVFFTDLVTPLPPALALFTNAEGAAAGLRVDTGTFRVVYTGFRLQSVKDRAVRAALTTRAMHWLLSTPTALEETASRAPLSVDLLPNVPNPFNGVTVFAYEIPVDGYVRVEVFNLLGQRQAVLVDRWQSAGRHEVAWDGTCDDGSAAASGVYVCRMNSNGVVAMRRMVVLR